MGPDVNITANCASGDDTIKEQQLKDGQDFAWMFSKPLSLIKNSYRTFRAHILGRTLFWCDVKTSNG